jgi:hypothetical protein
MRKAGLNGQARPSFAVDIVHPFRIGPRDLPIRSESHCRHYSTRM